jgi:hypothetical protein
VLIGETGNSLFFVRGFVMVLTMAECKELLEVSVSDLGMSSDGVYHDRGCPTVLINIIDLTENWAIDKREIEKRADDPKELIKLIKFRQFKTLRRLRDKIDAEIKKLGGTIDGPR